VTRADGVSVIVCTHLMERRGQLDGCLVSLRDQDVPPLEVIVVVDGNAALYTELLERGGPEVLLKTDSPSGLSAARNVGLKHARGTLVAFLDDDAVADDRWLSSLLSVLDDPDVAGASGLSYPRWDGGPPRWFPLELLWTVGCSYAGMPTERATVRNVFGGCACLRHELFDTLGGFSTELGRMSTGLAGCEETEFCMRVLENEPAMTFVHEPAAVIHHHVPAGRQSLGYVLRRCLGEGRSKAILRHRTHLPVRPLGPERNYVFRTVPNGLGRYMRQVVHGDIAGLSRAAVLVLSVLCTAWSFLTTLLGLVGHRATGAESAAPAVRPIKPAATAPGAGPPSGDKPGRNRAS
jgi:glucosyl-dolichyl phosphate glucuronosyltransferase